MRLAIQLPYSQVDFCRFCVFLLMMVRSFGGWQINTLLRSMSGSRGVTFSLFTFTRSETQLIPVNLNLVMSLLPQVAFGFSDMISIWPVPVIGGSFWGCSLSVEDMVVLRGVIAVSLGGCRTGGWSMEEFTGSSVWAGEDFRFRDGLLRDEPADVGRRGEGQGTSFGICGRSLFRFGSRTGGGTSTGIDFVAFLIPSVSWLFWIDSAGISRGVGGWNVPEDRGVVSKFRLSKGWSSLSSSIPITLNVGSNNWSGKPD